MVEIEEPELSAAQLHYSVEIEGGLPFPGRPTAREIDAILDDERGWVAVRGASFRQVADDPELRIILASPATTDALCAPLRTQGRVSCRNGDLVVINALRWAFGIVYYDGDLSAYRRYVVNHEVGHALGEAHVSCPGRGLPAPVMLQQTYGLDGCDPNPWPGVA